MSTSFPDAAEEKSEKSQRNRFQMLNAKKKKVIKTKLNLPVMTIDYKSCRNWIEMLGKD